MHRLLITTFLFSTVCHATTLTCHASDTNDSNSFQIMTADLDDSGRASIIQKIPVTVGEVNWKDLVVVNVLNGHINDAFIADGRTGVSAQWVNQDGVESPKLASVRLDTNQSASQVHPNISLECAIK